jgi:hypothetical protein
VIQYKFRHLFLFMKNYKYNIVFSALLPYFIINFQIWSQYLCILRSRKPRLTAVGILCTDHVTPSTRKSRHYFADSGGRSVGIVRLRTKATEFLSMHPRIKVMDI